MRFCLTLIFLYGTRPWGLIICSGCDDMMMWRYNDMMSWWHDDGMMIWWYADVMTWWWYDDMMTWWHYDMTIWWYEDMMTWRYDDATTWWWYGDMRIWWHNNPHMKIIWSNDDKDHPHDTPLNHNVMTSTFSLKAEKLSAVWIPVPRIRARVSVMLIISLCDLYRESLWRRQWWW